MRSLNPHALAALSTAFVLGCSLAPPRSNPAHTSGAPAPDRTRMTKPGTDLQRRWQAVYQELLGVPYRFGGRTRDGFDCSGLVQYAYRRFDGRTLPRTTEDLYRFGDQVGALGLACGDLVFYQTSGRTPGHVGIYLWDGWFLHSAYGDGVTLTRLDDPYYERRFLGARRL